MKKKAKGKLIHKLKSREFLIPLLLALFAFLLYANTIPNNYNVDDELVTQNHRLTKKGISAIPQIFVSPYYADEAGYKYEYRPIVLTTFAIEKTLFGENPHVSHFINVLLYALTAALLFITMSRLFFRSNVVFPLTITLLFIAHPLHTEVVASIKNRDEILALLGGISALFFAIRFFRNNKVGPYLLMLLFFGLAVLSKRSIYPFALIIPLAAIFFLKPGFKQLLIVTFPMAFVVVLMAPFFILRNKLIISAELTLTPLTVHLFHNRTDLVRRCKNNIIKIFNFMFLKVLTGVRKLGMFFKPIVAVVPAFFKKRREKTIRLYRSVRHSRKLGEAIGKIVSLIPTFLQVFIALIFLIGFVYAVVYDNLLIIIATTFLPSILYLTENDLLKKGLLVYQSILLSILSLVYWIYIIPFITIPLLFYLAVYHKNWRVIAGLALIPFVVLVWIGGRLFVGNLAISLPILYFGARFKNKPVTSRVMQGFVVLTLLLLVVSLIIALTIHPAVFVENTLLSLSAFLCIIILSINRLKPYLFQINLAWIFIIFILGFYVFSCKPQPDQLLRLEQVEDVPEVIKPFYQINIQHDDTRMVHLKYSTYLERKRDQLRDLVSSYKEQVTGRKDEIVLQIERRMQESPSIDTTVDRSRLKVSIDTVPPSPTKDAPDLQVMPVKFRPLEYVENPLVSIQDNSKRIGTSIYVLGKYLQLVIFPHPLNFYYGYKQIPLVDMSNPYVIISLILYLLLVGVAVYYHRRHPIISFGILVYMLSIVIFSNIPIPIAGMLGERLAYVASLGFCITLAYLLSLIFKIDLTLKNFSINAKYKYALAVILVLYSVKTFSRNLQWKDHLTLFRNDISHLEHSAHAHNLLGSALIVKSYKAKSKAEQTELIGEAIPNIKKAVEIEPGFINAWYNLARAYSLLPDYDKALKNYLKVIELDSTFTKATLKAAVILDQQGKSKQAEKLYKQTIRYEPQKVEAYTNLSFLYFKAGRYDASIAVNKRAIANNPRAYEPYFNIGQTYYQMGDIVRARDFYEKAYALNSRDKNLIRSLSNICRQMGDLEKAEFYRQKAESLSNGN